jgi:DNA-binding transcriptional MerR regulator
VAERRAAEPEETLTIEQLAHESGMSVRNIRNHQTRGLLPPPEVRARTGYYGSRHVERLRLIQQMQSEGIKLSGIERLLGGEGEWAERFTALRHAVTVPSEAEPAEVVTISELEERFGPASRNGKALARAQRLGVLIDLGDGTFEVPSPSLLRAAGEAVERGIPLPAALSVIEKVKRNADGAAAAFVKLFMDELWRPLEAGDQTPDHWRETTEAIERLRPLSAEVVLALFRQALASEIETAFSRALEEQAKKKP